MLFYRSIVDYASDIDVYYYKEEDKETFMRIFGDDYITVNFHMYRQDTIYSKYVLDKNGTFFPRANLHRAKARRLSRRG